MYLGSKISYKFTLNLKNDHKKFFKLFKMSTNSNTKERLVKPVFKKYYTLNLFNTDWHGSHCMCNECCLNGMLFNLIRRCGEHFVTLHSLI